MNSLWNDIIKPSGIPITIKEVESFEEHLGFKLPQDYKDFLLKLSGGLIPRRD